MSWFIAILPKREFQSRSEIDSLRKNLIDLAPTKPELILANEKMVLIGGGKQDTFKYKISDDVSSKSGWIVCGIGIFYDGDTPSTMRYDHWDAVLGDRAALSNVNRINGHYTIIKWDEQGYYLFCDELELRRLYISEVQDKFIISTRLDWIIPFLRNPVLKIEKLASEWMLVNSLSDECFIDGVTRLGASGRMSIINGKITHTWQPWTPTASPNSCIIPILANTTNLPLRERKKLTLGLSGGVDSRTLLALLSRSPGDVWQIHSCGNKGNQDVHIAAILAETLHLRSDISYFERRQDETIETMIQSLKEIALHEEISDPIFGYPRFQVFSKLSRQGFWMIDGGYGELLRRSYGNRLFLAGKRAIKEKNAAAMLPYLSHPKAAIFSDKILHGFRTQAEMHLQNAVDRMPEIENGDVGTWLDIFHIRYRLKNFPANGQAAYDQVIASYMPYAQSVLLSAYCSLASKQRRNNKFNRKIIREGDPALRKVPLVGSGQSMPYWTINHVLLSRVVSKFKRRFLTNSVDRGKTFRAESLMFLREYILDRLTSRPVKTCAYYNYPEIRRTVEDFYKGKIENDVFIEEWLAFDFWRELLDQPRP